MTAATAPVWRPDVPPASAPQANRNRGSRNRTTDPSPWVGCPVCGVVTLETVAGGEVLRVLDTASGIGDGARCTSHARTEDERAVESKRAMNIALYRVGRGGPWSGIDDTAQGTE